MYNPFRYADQEDRRRKRFESDSGKLNGKIDRRGWLEIECSFSHNRRVFLFCN